MNLKINSNLGKVFDAYVYPKSPLFKPAESGLTLLSYRTAKALSIGESESLNFNRGGRWQRHLIVRNPNDILNPSTDHSLRGLTGPGFHPDRVIDHGTVQRTGNFVTTWSEEIHSLRKHRQSGLKEKVQALAKVLRKRVRPGRTLSLYMLNHFADHVGLNKEEKQKFMEFARLFSELLDRSSEFDLNPMRCQDYLACEIIKTLIFQEMAKSGESRIMLFPRFLLGGEEKEYLSSLGVAKFYPYIKTLSAEEILEGIILGEMPAGVSMITQEQSGANQPAVQKSLYRQMADDHWSNLVTIMNLFPNFWKALKKLSTDLENF